MNTLDSAAEHECVVCRNLLEERGFSLDVWLDAYATAPERWDFCSVDCRIEADVEQCARCGRWMPIVADGFDAWNDPRAIQLKETDPGVWVCRRCAGVPRGAPWN